MLLFLKNLILIRTLKIKSVSLYDRVVIQGNQIEMLWNVRGCHKIKIKGIGTFCGNIHGFKFLFTNRNNPIEITFFGIARKTTKRVKIENTKIQLLEKFETSTKLPIAIEVPYNRQNFVIELSKDNLKMVLKNISFEFDDFDIENYKPANKI